MDKLDLVNKNKLREFLFYNGTLISKPEDVDLEKNVFVVYYQDAVVIDSLEDLHLKEFYNKENGDILFSLPKEKIPQVEL